MSISHEVRTQVLIVGGGPVGLSLAIELGSRGIRCILVEQHDRVGYNPRAKLTNVRTREHLRRWGIAERLREVSPIPRDYPFRIVFATRFDGHILATFDNAFNGSLERNEWYSESAQWVPQYTLENVLRERAETFPNVEIRFNARLTEAEESDGGVVSTVEDVTTGVRSRVRSSYVVGADGVRSRVREILGIAMEGEHGLARFLNVIFLAPSLAGSHALGRAIQYWFVNGELPVALSPMDDGVEGRWFLNLPLPPSEAGLEHVHPRELVRRGTGLDVPMEIVGVDPWTSHTLVATRYSRGRVFLAGDACHTHPPFGGYGMNMGIGDAVDLGWKMAAALQGWGGAALLESYEAERRPIHQLVIREALANQAVLGHHLVRPEIEAEGSAGESVRAEVGRAIVAAKSREFHTLGVVLGYRYQGSPIVASDGRPAPPDDYSQYTPAAHPGSVAPHAWLADGSSLYNRIGLGFTLLVTEATTGDVSALAGAAAQRGVPLTVLAPGEPRLAELYGARYALIRPDQHVAWRGDDLPSDPLSLIDHVTGARAVAESVPA